MTPADWLAADRRTITRLRRIFDEEVPQPTTLARRLIDYVLPRTGRPTARPSFRAMALATGLAPGTLVCRLNRTGIRRPKHVVDAVVLARLAALLEHGMPLDEAAAWLCLSSTSGLNRLVRSSRGITLSAFRDTVTAADMQEEWRELLQFHRAALSTHTTEVPA